MDLSKYKKAKLALEYRPEISAIADEFKTHPIQFQETFLDLLEDNPQINAESLEKTVLDDFSQRLLFSS